MTDPLSSLTYSELEQDLRTTMAAVLREHADWASVLASIGADRVDLPPLWSLLSKDIGVVGLAVPESAGGGGASWREVAVVLEELGRTVAPVPYFTSSVLATSTLQAAGPSAASALQEVAAGTTIAALVVPWGAPVSTARAVDVTADGNATGTVAAVAGALDADLLLVPTSAGLALVRAADAVISPIPSLDMTRQLADVTFEATACTMLTDVDTGRNAVSRAGTVSAALLASEQLGLAERCLEMTVEYLKERHQFGRPLGSYQALKHRLADLWTDITRARAVARYAAACAATDADDLPVAASLAQTVCSRTAQLAAEECVQMHGGIGFTWEHSAHLYLKRARATALGLGTPAWHRDHLATLVDLAPASR